jgi:hypothetical protein
VAGASRAMLGRRLTRRILQARVRQRGLACHQFGFLKRNMNWSVLKRMDGSNTLLV